MQAAAAPCGRQHRASTLVTERDKMAKAISIKLAHFIQDSVPKYKVITVKNSTARSPGEILNRHDVDVLCESSRWEVIIVPHQPKEI